MNDEPPSAPNDARSLSAHRAVLEQAARAACEERLRRNLGDREWASWRAKMLEFANMLLVWNRQADAKETRVDNVVVMSKPRLNSGRKAA
jgi:hypothetical protein